MVRILWGPPFAAKSQVLEQIAGPEEAVIDTTSLWRSLFPATAAKVRSTEVATYVHAVKVAAVREAVRNDIDAWVPVSTADRTVLKYWMEDAATDEVTVLAPPRQNAMAEAIKRGRRDGTDECQQIVASWYDGYIPEPSDVPFDLGEWGIDPNSRLGRYLTVGGTKMGGTDTRSDGARYVTFNAGLEIREARVEGGRPVLRGVVLRYGDRSKLGYRFEEEFRPGSIQWDDAKPMNLTRQHYRGAPVGLVRLTDGPNELRFESEIIDTQAGNDTVKEVKAGLMRGASLEFHAVSEEFKKEDDIDLRVVTKALMTGLSVVDDGAFGSGRVEARAEVRAARDRWRDELAARRAADTLAAMDALRGAGG